MKKDKPLKPIDANDKATHEWLNAQKRSTRNAYRSAWRKIAKFTGMSGDEILASRKADKTGLWERKVLQLKQWVKKQGLSDYTARQTTVALRSFFSFHRTELEMTHQESNKLRQAKRKTADYKFSVEDLSRMDAVGDTEEKYVVTVGKSFGLRVGDFIRLTRGHFDAIDLEQKPPISLGEIITIKEAVPAYPFIDSDAVTRVKALLEKMDREGRTDAAEPMLTYKNTLELTRVLKRLVEEAVIKTGNKRVRFHCLRKFLTDRLSDVMSESKWKQIVGKTISEDAYVSVERLREDYERAMKETTFTKPLAEDDMKLLARKEALIMLAKLQGASEDDMKKIFRSKKATTMNEQVKVLEEFTEQNKPKNNNCTDGQNCQRVVAEEQLEPLLTQGWRVAAVLPSGKIVVSNEA